MTYNTVLYSKKPTASFFSVEMTTLKMEAVSCFEILEFTSNTTQKSPHVTF